MYHAQEIIIHALRLVAGRRLRDGESAQLRDIRVLVGGVLVPEAVDDGDEEGLSRSCQTHFGGTARASTHTTESVELVDDVLMFPPDGDQRAQVARNGLPHDVYSTSRQLTHFTVSKHPRRSHSFSFLNSTSNVSELLSFDNPAFAVANASLMRPMRSSSVNSESSFAASRPICARRSGM